MSLTFKRWSSSVSSAASKTSDSLMLGLSLNSFATATASLFPGDVSGVADVPLRQIAQALGAAQARAYSSTTSSFSARLSADGGSISFEGHEISPSMSVAVGSFQPAIQAIHSTSRIGQLQMDLYNDTPTAAIDLAQSPNIPERLMDIVERLVRAWIKDTYPSLNDKEKQLASVIHERNTEPLRILQNILQSSPAFVIEELSALLETAQAWHDGFNQWMASSLMVGRGDFWGAFVNLLSQLGMVYCPVFGDASANGTVRALGLMLQSPQDRNDLDALRIDGAIAPVTNPITRVIIEKVPLGGSIRNYEQNQRSRVPGQSSPTSVVYPPGARIGKAYVMDPPAFMGPVLYNAVGSPAGTPSIKPGEARARIAKINAITQQRADAIRAYLTAVARNVFRMLVLQDSTVSVSVPASLDWQVGTAYAIGNGSPLFTGLLNSVQHTTSTSAQQLGTHLNFSHVQWTGFNVSSLE